MLANQKEKKWVRPNHATTQNYPQLSTTIHHLAKYIQHQPPPPTTSQNISTTTHHHLPPAKVYPPPSINSYHYQKNGPLLRKYITSFRSCFNSFFFFEVRQSFKWRRVLCDKVLISSFFKFKLLLHFTMFKIF